MRCTLVSCYILFLFFFFNDTATTEIYTLSLHDALPIFGQRPPRAGQQFGPTLGGARVRGREQRRERAERDRADRKSTRLNSSHANISYAVFCLKKKKKKINALNYTCIPSGPLSHT